MQRHAAFEHGGEGFWLFARGDDGRGGRGGRRRRCVGRNGLFFLDFGLGFGFSDEFRLGSCRGHFGLLGLDGHFRLFFDDFGHRGRWGDFFGFEEQIVHRGRSRRRGCRSRSGRGNAFFTFRRRGGHHFHRRRGGGVRVELREAEAADQRDGDGVSEFRIDGETEEHVRGIGHVFAQRFHDAFRFEQRERFATGDVHEQRLRLAQKSALIDERALQRLLHGFRAAILAAGLAKAEQAATVRGAKCGGEVIEAQLHQSRRGGDGGDGAQGLRDELVGLREGFLDAILRQHELAHAIVFKQDERVAALLQEFERFLRLADAAAAFKAERHGRDDDDERAGVLRDLRDDRCGAAAGAAAESGADEDDVMPVDGLADLLAAEKRGLAAEIGITTGADALHDFDAELHLHGCHAVAEHAHVRVHADERGLDNAVERDAIDDIGAGAADADDANARGCERGGTAVAVGAMIFDHKKRCC